MLCAMVIAMQYQKSQKQQEPCALLLKRLRIMVELGILREGNCINGESYFPRIYKFDKILNDRAEFRNIIADWLQEMNQRTVYKAESSLAKADAGIEQARASAPQAEKLNAEIKEAERWSGKTAFMDDRKEPQISCRKETVSAEIEKA